MSNFHELIIFIEKILHDEDEVVIKILGRIFETNIVILYTQITDHVPTYGAVSLIYNIYIN